MGAEQSSAAAAPLTADARRRHQHFIAAFRLIIIDRRHLRPGSRVQILRGGNAGLAGTVREEGFSEERGAWCIDVEHPDGSVEDWWLARHFFKIDDPRADAAAVAAAERMLAGGLITQFEKVPPERPADISWPGMFSSPQLPESFCPYPDGCQRTRRCHRWGVGATGWFQVLPELDPSVPPNAFFRAGKTLPVTVRHSNMACSDDAAMDIRGMAISFAEPGAVSPLDLCLTTGPASPWWSANSLTEFADAHLGGVEEMQQFLSRNPHSFAAYIRALKRAPESYAQLHYHSHSAYELLGDDIPRRTPGTGGPHTPGHHVRFRVSPVAVAAHAGSPSAVDPAAEEDLPPRDALSPWHPARTSLHPTHPGLDEDGNPVRDREYLRDEFHKRMQLQPVMYWLEAQIFPDDHVDEIRGQAHLNPTEFPLNPLFALEDDRGVWTQAQWVRLGEIILDEPLDDAAADSQVFSVGHRPACLRPTPTASGDDFGSLLRAREILFPPVYPPPVPAPPGQPQPRDPTPRYDGAYGGLVRYSITFYVGDSVPRGPAPDEAQVSVQFLGKKDDTAIETRPLRLSHWASNSFRTTRWDNWMVHCPEDIRDISVLKVTLKPVGKYTKWFLKRVDVRQERPTSAPWAAGDELVLLDAAGMRQAFERNGIEWKEGLAKRARQVCTVVDCVTEPSPGGGEIDAVTVEFRDSKKHFMYPREACEPYNPPLCFPAYQWLEEGELFLFEASPMLAAVEADRQALAWRQTLLAQRRQEYPWDTPTGSFDVPWDPPHRLPIGLRQGVVPAPNAVPLEDTDGPDVLGSSVGGRSPERVRCAARAVRDHSVGGLLEREAKDLLLRRVLASPGEDRVLVQTPHGQQHVQGAYSAAAFSLESLPVWVRSDALQGGAWLRSYQGHWVVTETPPDSGEPPQVALMSCEPHRGALPVAMQRQPRAGPPAWQRAAAGGMWQTDPAISLSWDGRWWAEGDGLVYPETVWETMYDTLFAQGAQRDAVPLPLRRLPGDQPGGDRAWLTDEEFARHFTAGALCMCLEHLSAWQRDAAGRGGGSGDFCFQDSDIISLIPDRIAARVGGRPTIAALAGAGLLYVVDLGVMEGLPCQAGRYTCAPLVLFLGDDTEPTLLPLAVQLHQRGTDSRVWTRENCVVEDWLAVKTCVLSAAAHVQFFGHRMLYCHMVAEPFVVATLRHLPDMHPVYKLLHPHMKRTLAAIAQMRAMAEPDSPVLRAFALTASGVRLLQERMYSRWFLDRCNNFHYNIQQARQVEALAWFPYREQVCDLWDVIQGYTQEALQALYVLCYNEDLESPSSDTQQQLQDNVAGDDPEVQVWLGELARALRRSSWQALFSEPRPRQAGLQDLVDVCSSFIWTVTVQQAAMTHSMWDTYAWPAGAPFALYAEPPHTPLSIAARGREAAGLSRLFGILPGRQLCAFQVVLVWLLSRGAQMVDLAVAHRGGDVLEHPVESGGGALPLGWWNEDVFVLPELRGIVRRFRQTLEQVSARLQEARPHGAPARHPDVFPVDPRLVPNSLLPLSRRAHPTEDRLPGHGSSLAGAR